MDKPGFFRFNRRNRWLFYLVLMGIALLFSMQKKQAEQTMVKDQPAQVMAVTAQDLARQYRDDAEGAKDRFYKKRLEVTGQVFEAGTALGKPYVKFVTGEGESRVRFFADRDRKEWVGTLKPGDEVTVTGVCQGYIADVVVLE